MKATTQERLFWWVGVPALAGVLITLGVLQYRWSEQVSDATRAQMQSGLQTSLMGFRQDLARELGAVCLELRPSGDDSGKLQPSELSRQFQHWQQTAAHPSLVAQVYAWQNSGESSALLRLDPSHNQLDAVAWPPDFDPLRQHLEAMPTAVGHTPVRAPHHHDDRARGQAPRRISDPFLPWFVDQSIPALVYPWRHRAASGEGNSVPAVTWIIVQLNPTALEKEVFPELTQKYFRGDYKVAVLPGSGAGHVLYSSAAGFGEAKDAAYDGDVNLFGPPFRRNDPLRPGLDLFSAGGRASLPPGARSQQQDDRRNQALDRPRLEPFPYSAQEGVWQIVVKHQRGSVEAVVSALRRRHLIASFGVLVLLAVTMALVLIASQRAHRLAALQMNFVAGVSHELRTPLAVISSAAENIAHGVVSDPQQLARYSASILKQTRQLTQLVEQVLFFATTQQKMGQYQLRPVDVSQVIDAALEDTAGIVATAGVKIERRIEPGLPAVAADFAALSQCLQNLITNAVKYGGEQRWIGVRAAAQREDGQVRGVQITVEDKGIGISPQEIKHIFEPFYRSPAVVGSNVHGTGLGLPLARTVIEAMRGRLTVESEPGRGSCFTIHLTIAAGLLSPDRETASGRISGETAGSYPS
jgi:signal transduction histidine kinase